MARWKTKECPRCGGDMFIDRDLDSWYEQCLQCSKRIELKEVNAIKSPPVAVVNRKKNQPNEVRIR